MDSVTFCPVGDSAVSLSFGNVICPETNRRIRSFCRALEQYPITGMTETLPTFCSVMICYQPLDISYHSLVRQLKKRLRNLKAQEKEQGRIFQIPVCYGEDLGEDLSFVAANAGLTPEQVIELHSGRDYLIYMLGFLPGFAYLGGLDSRLFTPRLEIPRTCIPAGSVGIGGEQTGIYPLDSPGGWRLIGRTPLRPYDPDRSDPILYRAGDSIRFFPVSRAEYEGIAHQVEEGCYQVKVEGRDGL